MEEIRTKLKKDAFAVSAICGKYRNPFGFTVNPEHNGGTIVWAFPMKEGQAKREGYESRSVSGTISNAPDFNGCPYCGAKSFWFCGCGAIVCFDGKMTQTCPKCGWHGELVYLESVTVKGGGL